MTVKELRDLLAKFPDDLPVIYEYDGRGYTPHVAQAPWYTDGKGQHVEGPVVELS